jgi:CubicO group peptidase (beta-lactamase class C family)
MALRPLAAALIAVLLLAPAPPALAEDLTPVLAAAMAGTQVPAMAILVIQDGKIAGQAVRGVRRNDAPDPARIGDVWHIGSDGKAMTATLIARLVDRGLLAWDIPLERMLPELAATMRPQYRQVTLLQLLSHHAGLPHDLIDIKAIEAFYADPRPLPAQRLAYLALALKDPPLAPPGTSYNYSNTGFVLAAAIAERAAHAPYEDLMRREVFTPLGMTSVGFGLTHGDEPRGHYGGKPIRETADGKPIFVAPDGADGAPLFFAPAGNIHLAIGDWAKFCLDQMAGAHGRGKLLKPATYALMQTAQPGDVYGLGWGVQPTLAGRRGPALTHTGSDGDWYAVVVLFPGSQSGVLATANAGESMAGDKAARAAARALLPTLSPPAPAAAK